MSRLDEALIIKTFQRKFGNKRFVSEDVETLRFGGKKIFVKADTLVQSTDMPPGMGLSEAARKSMVACVSDFAAKGIRPEYGIISVNLPKTIIQRQVEEIATGFKKASTEFGFTILGGDTNRGKEIVLGACIIGRAKKIIPRKGSKIGDLIFVTGPFGYTPIGLDCLLSRTKKTDAITKKAINCFLKPKPKLSFALKAKRYFSSSMDSSDGLSTTLNTMAQQSGKKFVITKIPARKDIRDYARTGKHLIDLVFHGGEEYEFAFTADSKFRAKIRDVAGLQRTPIIEIGHVESGKGVELEQGVKRTVLKDLGWKHFG